MESKHFTEEQKVLTWPHLLYREFIASFLILILIWIWSLTVNAPLEMRANPTHSPNPAKAPWYFLGLQELLVYFDPWIAGVVIPGLMIVGLMVIPYVDPSRKAIGEYTVRERPFAVPFFLLGLLLWFGLIVIGTFLRGPSWNWYWPWEGYEVSKEVVPTRDVPPIWGWILTLLYLGLGWIFPKRLKFLSSLDPVRYSIVIFFVLCFVGIFLKMGLRLFFDVKYLLVTPWFNI